MALSRLRYPVISRAPSLLRARLLSSHRSLPRSSRLLDSFADLEGTLSRKVGELIWCLPKRKHLLLLPHAWYAEMTWKGKVNPGRIYSTQNGNTHFPVFGGLHDYSSKIKLQSGVRYFSSADPFHTVIGMPALSPTMSQGNIAKWRKKEGDKIDVGDVLCEIETDKATLEFESLEEGFLAKIMVPEGSKDVPVGQPIAITVEDPDDIKNVSAIAGSETEAKEETSQKSTNNEKREQETSSLTANTSELPPHFVLGMPALSPTMSQGNIFKWRKQEGDKIEVGDVLCEIETDKATLEFESLEEGFLAKILVPDGSKDVAVGQPIAVTVEDPNDIGSVKSSFSGDTLLLKEDKPVHHDSTTKQEIQKSSFSRISPSAKLLIVEHGLDASLITPSGPRGTILKGDVLAAIKSGKGSAKISPNKADKPSSPGVQPETSSASSGKSDLPRADAFEDLPNSQIRKVIATRLLESKQSTPHLYLSSDVILDPLLSFRKELKEKFDVKVSVNDIVIKVVAVALRNVPDANAYWDVQKGEAVLCDAVDISIAVATDKGLMTPIIKNADQKSISAISSEIKELAERARAGRLKPNEFQGGTFSISNLGMFPVDHFCAIINPPQAGILAVGRGNQVVEPVVGEDGIEKPGVVTKMNLTLSADHRVFDGHIAGAFVAALRSNFADIRRLLL